MRCFESSFIIAFFCVMAGNRGRPSAPTGFVELGDLLDRDRVLAEQWSLVRLGAIYGDRLGLLRWLAARRLIKNSFLCQDCQIPCSLIADNEVGDGYIWKCKQCRRKASIRDGSFFTRSHLSLSQLVTILYCWSRDMSHKDISNEAELSLANPHVLVDWSNFCREVCEEWLVQNPLEVGGFDDNGEPIVVEIDETKYFHRKYHRGQWREGHWVFGGVERGSNRCFMVEVPDRTAATLEALIQRYILPGSHIVSDGWSA